MEQDYALVIEVPLEPHHTVDDIERAAQAAADALRSTNKAETSLADGSMTTSRSSSTLDD